MVCNIKIIVLETSESVLGRKFNFTLVEPRGGGQGKPHSRKSDNEQTRKSFLKPELIEI